MKNAPFVDKLSKGGRFKQLEEFKDVILVSPLLVLAGQHDVCSVGAGRDSVAQFNPMLEILTKKFGQET